MSELVSKIVDRFGPVVRITCSWSPYGWAHAYVDNDKGTLMICSDWGDWTYRWGLSGLPAGQKLDEFIFQRTDDRWGYVANKLLGGETREYDHEKTQSWLRKRLAEEYRSSVVTHLGAYAKQTYRDAITDIAVCEDFDALHDSEAIDAFITVDYEDQQTSHSQTYRNLTELILPALAQAWQDATRPTAAVAQP